MAFPTRTELNGLVAELVKATEAYSDTSDLKGSSSRAQIISKAKQLARSVKSPEQAAMQHGFNIVEVIALRTFQKLKVFDAIPRTGSISLKDLSAATGVQDSLLERQARILVATGFLDQTRPDGGDYMHTKFSVAYLLDKPGSGYLFQLIYDFLKPMHNFDEYLEARGQLAHATEPVDIFNNPWTFYNNQDGTNMWKIIEQKKEQNHNFQIGLAGFDPFLPVVGHFDFDKLRNSPEDKAKGILELIDVGGGRGNGLKSILDTHPALTASSCMLQERLEILEISQKDQILPPDTKLMIHDFMSEQPIRGAKAYFMRFILHDYSDAVSTEILRHLAKAMSPESRVLIVDMILPNRISETDMSAGLLDNIVMSIGGKERTKAGFEKMFNTVGLDLVHIWRVPGVPGACVEGKLKA